jgi:serine/threonine protein phosphatase PrpC
VDRFFSSIFKRKKKYPYDVKTAPLTDDQLKNVSMASNLPVTSQLIIGCGLSVGLQRDQNEDSLFTFSSKMSGEDKNLIYGLFIVADGMGGHEHGELASTVAINAMSTYITKKMYLPLFGVKQDQPSDPLHELMQNAINEAQQSVVRYAPGGGTTITSAFILGDQVTLAHVGDSRAYFIYPDGRLQTVTRDHSLVRRLQELGQISDKEAAEHPQRNVLYRALGQNEPFEPDINTYPFPNGGYLMLCSDGLWNVITESEIYPIIKSSPSLNIACQRLIDAANNAGGPDNISVILVQYLM